MMMQTRATIMKRSKGSEVANAIVVVGRVAPLSAPAKA